MPDAPLMPSTTRPGWNSGRCKPAATDSVCATIVLAGFMVGWPWATTAVGQVTGKGARVIETHGAPPTPPPRFGYHGTQWRRWPEGQPQTPAVKDATPARPPKLEIPKAKEEAPPRPVEDLPPPAAAASGTETTPVGLTLEQRSAALAGQAAAAKAGTREQQTAFTRQLVAEILAADDYELRSRIVAMAADFDTPEADAICTGAMQDPHERVRMAACTAWGRRGGPSAVQLLANRVETDAELGVKLRALNGLADLGNRTAILAIAKALDDADPVVRKRAMQALKNTSGRDFGDDVEAWRNWAKNPEAASSRWSWAEALRKIF